METIVISIVLCLPILLPWHRRGLDISHESKYIPISQRAAEVGDVEKRTPTILRLVNRDIDGEQKTKKSVSPPSGGIGGVKWPRYFMYAPPPIYVCTAAYRRYFEELPSTPTASKAILKPQPTFTANFSS
jgi:hypothetical protein